MHYPPQGLWAAVGVFLLPEGVGGVSSGAEPADTWGKGFGGKGCAGKQFTFVRFGVKQNKTDIS